MDMLVNFDLSVTKKDEFKIHFTKIRLDENTVLEDNCDAKDQEKDAKTAWNFYIPLGLPEINGNINKVMPFLPWVDELNYDLNFDVQDGYMGIGISFPEQKYQRDYFEDMPKTLFL
jgi:hypothetical protein